MKLGNKNNLYVLQNTYKFILQIICDLYVILILFIKFIQQLQLLPNFLENLGYILFLKRCNKLITVKE